MDKFKMKMFVLHGYWNFEESDGVIVVLVTTDESEAVGRLGTIRETKAAEYFDFPYIDTIEESSDRMYEIQDDVLAGTYAKFYITEHEVELPVEKMYEISRKADRENRTNDVLEYLKNRYEAGTIEEWKYEYMTNKQSVVDVIVQHFEQIEDCNTPYNVTMEIAVERYMAVIVLTDDVLRFLWERFGSIPVDDEGIMEDDFLQFHYGDSREEVWKWFDEKYSKGVGELMNGGK